MDSRLIFLHWYEGFKRNIGEGQWREVMEYLLYIRVTYGLSLGFAPSKFMCPCFLEKYCDTDMPAVPKPTQVGGYKYTKARERNLVKELGNIAP